MPPEHTTVALVGLGLMGASLGMALRASGHTVAGCDAAPGVATRARERGAVDVACWSVAEAVAGAQIVVLATPVLAMRDLLATLAPSLAPGAIVTDLGSAKAQVVAWAEASLPNRGHFVGGHPMTGRERSGVDAAERGLYAGCVWALTPTSHTAAEALAQMRALVKSLGARPLVLDAADHDTAVAGVSHLPLLAATALMRATATAPTWPLAQRLAAGGFRDTTRLASGDPRMARDILLTNREPILASLDAYIVTLQRLREQVDVGDASVEEEFAAAKRARDAWQAEAVGHAETGEHDV